MRTPKRELIKYFFEYSSLEDRTWKDKLTIDLPCSVLDVIDGLIETLTLSFIRTSFSFQYYLHRVLQPEFLEIEKKEKDLGDRPTIQVIDGTEHDPGMLRPSPPTLAYSPIEADSFNSDQVEQWQLDRFALIIGYLARNKGSAYALSFADRDLVRQCMDAVRIHQKDRSS